MSPRRRDEQAVVAEADFGSYYGKPVLNGPVWQARDIAGYLFLGGLAGASSLLGAGAQAAGMRVLERIAKPVAAGAAALSLAALIDDLGRPARFLNMLRVVKPSSPMNMGSWLLAGYVPMAGAAAGAAITGRLPRIGAAATAGAALVGPAVASYTATLLSDTAVPAWHDAYRELPFVFVGSGATAAGGLGLLAPYAQTAPARNMALFGVACELLAAHRMQRRTGMVGTPYSAGRSGAYVKAGKALSVAGALGAVAGGRSRFGRALSGAALVVSSALTRFGVFHAGIASAEDPAYTVGPQRERLAQRYES